MQISDCFYLGIITRKHGLKGHILVKLDTDEPETYYKMESVLIEINNTLIPFFIKEIFPNGSDGLRILFENSVFPIEQLLQKKIYLPLTFLPKLEGKKFYFHEVLGFYLKENDTIIGKIIEINDNGLQNLFVIQNLDLKHILIPIVKDWILEVNREQRYISMDLPNGILDL